MSKKILFYTKMNFGNPNNIGIKKKVSGQRNGLQDLSFETDLFYIENQSIILERNNNVIEKIDFENKFSFLKFLYFDFISSFNIENYDVFFLRHFPMHPLSYLMIYWIRKKNPNIKIIVEFPTYPYSIQLKRLGWKQYFNGLIDDIFTPLSMRYTDIMLTFSQDETIFEKPTIITSNGIDTQQFQPIIAPPLQNELNLVGLANVQIWHGYDRVIMGLKKYYADFNSTNLVVKFHIIGKGNESENLIKLANETGMKDYVVFHGPTFGLELQHLLSQCHLGLGALADYRVGMNNTLVSPLKNREYCAMGIPFICTYKDSDLPDDFPFILVMEANETPLDIPKAIEYYKKLAEEKPNYPQEMHEFAKENLSWASKLSGVKTWLNE